MIDPHPARKRADLPLSGGGKTATGYFYKLSFG